MVVLSVMLGSASIIALGVRLTGMSALLLDEDAL